MRPLGCKKTRSTHVGAYEDNKLGKARERRTVANMVRDELGRDEEAHAVKERLTAAKQAVVDAAKASLRHGYITNTLSDLYDALTALAKLEGE